MSVMFLLVKNAVVQNTIFLLSFQHAGTVPDLQEMTFF